MSLDPPLRDLERLGGDGRHPVAYEADAVFCDDWNVAESASVEDIADILTCQHAVDAGQGRGGGRVDVDDTGVRQGAAQGPAPQETAHAEVGGVLRGAGDLLGAVDSRNRLAQHPRGH